MKSIRDVREGDDSLSASELNRAFEEVERSANVYGEPPIEVVRDDTGMRIRWAKEIPFWAKLTGRKKRHETSGSGNSGSSPPSGISGSGSGSGEQGCLYSWTEQTSSLDTCGLVDASGAREGFVDDLPAMDALGSRDLTPDTPALLILADTGDHYLILIAGPGGPSDAGSGGCAGSESVSRSITITAVEKNPQTGECCDRTFTLTFPFDVRVCEGPLQCHGSGGGIIPLGPGGTPIVGPTLPLGALAPCSGPPPDWYVASLTPLQVPFANGLWPNYCRAHGGI